MPSIGRGGIEPNFAGRRNCPVSPSGASTGSAVKDSNSEGPENIPALGEVVAAL